MTCAQPDPAPGSRAPVTARRVLAAVPPAGWAILAGAAQLAVVRCSPRRVSSRRHRDPAGAAAGVLGPAAGVLGLAAGAVGIGAVVEFAAERTTVHPHTPGRATALVTSGPLRYSRNPMYLALAGGLTATAMALRAPVALLPVAGFVAVMDRVQIPIEEEALQARFGEAYAAYRGRVRRWF